MVRPDYRNFKNFLSHSAKGSVWEDHKYVKRVNGTYYYPNGYEGGRTMESFRKDLRNKRFTQAQVNADASAKKSSSSPSTRTVSTKNVTRKLATSATGTAKLSDINETASQNLAKKKAKEVAEGKNSKKKVTDKNLSAKDIEKYAKEVIRGNYGVGAERKKLLGDNYRKIQDKVNELMRKSGSTKVSTAKSSFTSSKTTATKKTKTKGTSKKKVNSKTSTSSTSAKKGIDLNKVYDVYNKRKR